MVKPDQPAHQAAFRRKVDAAVQARKPVKRADGSPETVDEWLAHGGQLEVIPSTIVPRPGYPRPHFRKGKGGE